MAPTLCLPSRYSNLACENLKLSDAISTEMKNKTKTKSGSSSFLEKFNESCCVKSVESPFEDLFNLDRMGIMYERASDILDEYYSAIRFEQVTHKSDNKTDSKCILKNFNRFY